MVPEDLRIKRTKKIEAQAPSGTSWCAGCQSFRDLEDFAKGMTQCRACASSRAHAATIEKTYGITGDDYDSLLKAQGGKCAICRARPRSKRLAVDHDHKTGAVRGLLCSRCNHDLLGSAWDSLAMAVALWHYMNTPPAGGAWLPPEAQPQLAAVDDAARPSRASTDDLGIVATRGAKRAATGRTEAESTAPREDPPPYPPLVPLYEAFNDAVAAIASGGGKKAAALTEAVEGLSKRGLLVPPPF